MKSFGEVKRLWRYPVKSLLGESCTELFVDCRGVVKDRWYAISNSQGKFGSGKNTRRFRKIEGLFELKANYDGDVLLITFPDGRVFKSDDPNLDRELSSTLGQPVTLVSEKNISHFDADSLHLITTASLNWLRTLLPNSAIDERRFRPNLLIDLLGEESIEHNWIGQKFVIGRELEIEITDLTERCIMISLAQEELECDRHILRTINEKSGHNFGVYAKIIKPGIIRVGDKVNGDLS